jgi:RNA polymerase sigma-70 factor (ECF subfamily)
VEDSEARRLFEELYVSTYRKVLAYALRRTSNREDAHEVVAETFLVAWRRLKAAIAADNSLAWLYGVARGVLANQRRRQKRRERLDAKLEGSVFEVVPDTAQREMDGRGLLAEVTRLLKELPPRYQEILMLTSYEGLSPAEIAPIVQLPPAVVRTLLYRARLRLRRILDEEHPGWELVIKSPE